MAVVRKFVLLIPLIYLLPGILPLEKTTSVYLAEPAADTLAVTFTAILLPSGLKKLWKSLRKVSPGSNFIPRGGLQP